MKYPDRIDPCWQSPEWRTETLLGIMKGYGLRAKDVADLTGTSRSTVACWRKTAARPITMHYLKSLIYEISRGLV